MLSEAVLRQQIAQLPATQRIELVESILQDLDAAAPSIDALWAQEAERRLGAYQRGEMAALPAEQVMAKYGTK